MDKGQGQSSCIVTFLSFVFWGSFVFLGSFVFGLFGGGGGGGFSLLLPPLCFSGVFCQVFGGWRMFKLRVLQSKQRNRHGSQTGPSDFKIKQLVELVSVTCLLTRVYQPLALPSH